MILQGRNTGCFPEKLGQCKCANERGVDLVSGLKFFCGENSVQLGVTLTG